MATTKNIFISHYGEDDRHVQRLKERLKDENYDVRNFSVDSTKHKDGRRPSDAVIERHLRRQIRLSSTFICLLGPETHKRRWVREEIKMAHLQGKQIVGFYTYGNANSVKLPYEFKKYGGSTLGWNSIDKLGDIIEGRTTVVENPDGSQRSPNYSMVSVPC